LAQEELRSDADRDTTSIDEIVVTGSHIRGIESSSTMPRVEYNREDIDRRGYLSTQEFIRSLPQNFKGGENGASEDGVVGSAMGLNNAENASGVNLRGLGTSSTLVLLNGHRLAPSAFGSAVDVSAIPLTAIERIEVVTDGASSVYGSDAVGGVVNFDLRRDYSGAETTIQGGAVTSGRRSQYLVSQTVGGSWDTGSVLASLQYDDAQALRSSDRSFTETMPQPTDLYPDTTQTSGLLTARQELTRSVEAFTDVLYSKERNVRDYTVPNRTRRTKADSDFISANAGIGWRGPSDWRVELSGLHSEIDTSLKVHFKPDFPGYTNGAPYLRNRFRLQEANLVGDGPLFSIPGGAVRAAIGVSHRDEEFSSTAEWTQVERLIDRRVRAAFAELNAPLIGSGNSRPLLRRLSLSASVRYDEYSDFGNTTNPQFGVLWSPSETLDLRAAYGTSFHAPDVSHQVANTTNLVAFNYSFALPEGGVTPVLVVAGSPGLLPEKSRNMTFGGDYRPAFAPGLTLSWNYYDIRYRDRLVKPPFDLAALLKPEVYGPLITRFHSDDEAAAQIARLISQGFEFQDFLGTGAAGILYSYNFALTNASQVRQRGVDARVSYVFAVGENEFDLGLEATLIDQIRTGFCPSCTSVDFVDTFGQPLRKRMRTMLSWSRGSWRINGAVNYANSYADATAAPARRISSHTTMDMNVRFTPDFLKGVTAGFNVINLFDREPPHTMSGMAFQGMHYDSANADPMGRFVSLQIRKAW